MAGELCHIFEAIPNLLQKRKPHILSSILALSCLRSNPDGGRRHHLSISLKNAKSSFFDERSGDARHSRRHAGSCG